MSQQLSLFATARSWWALGVFCVAGILSYTDRQILSLLVDPLRQDLNISDTGVSLLQGVAFALIYSIAGIPLGRMADLIARKRVIIGGVLLWSGATVWCGYANSFGELFCARVLVGIGEAALAPAALSMIADYFPPQRRGTATGVFLMGLIVGAGAAIALGGALLGAARDGAFHGLPFIGDLPAWRTTLIVLGAPGLLVAALMMTIREPARQNRVGGGGALPLRDVLAVFARERKVMAPLYAAMALLSMGDFSLLNWTPALLSRKFAMTAGQIGVALGTASILAAIVGNLGAGLLSDWRARKGGAAERLPLALVFAALGVFGALVGFAHTAEQVVGIFALWILMSSAAQIIGITAVQGLVPNETRGVAISLIAFFNMIVGLAGGSTATALLTDRVFGDPLSVGLSITAVSLPAGLAAAWFYWRALVNAGRGLRQG